MTGRTLARILMLIAVQSGAVCTASTTENTESFGDLRTSLDSYLKSAEHLKSEITITRVARLSTGRISEKTYNVECLIRKHLIRTARYSQGIVDGRKQWFDIRESLIFPSGETVEWRHPGFPGQLSFGKDTRQASRLRYSASELGDALYPLRKIQRAMKRDFRIVDDNSQTIVARALLGDDDGDSSEPAADDYIEIVFSKEFGHLPVSMTRICDDTDSGVQFFSGAGFRIEYALDSEGRIIPTVAEQDTRLKDDMWGALATTWTYRLFDLSEEPSADDMSLTVPYHLLAKNVDSGREFKLTTSDDKDTGILTERYGNLLKILPREHAMRTVATSFVGQCPDLPEMYRQLKLHKEPDLSSTSGFFGSHPLVLIHGCALLAAATVIVLRRQRTRSTR